MLLTSFSSLIIPCIAIQHRMTLTNGSNEEKAIWNVPDTEKMLVQQYAKYAYHTTSSKIQPLHRLACNTLFLYRNMVTSAMMNTTTLRINNGRTDSDMPPSPLLTHRLYTVSATPIPSGSIVPTGMSTPTTESINTSKRNKVCLRCSIF